MTKTRWLLVSAAILGLGFATSLLSLKGSPKKKPSAPIPVSMGPSWLSEDPGTALFVVRKGGKEGFIDASGTVVIEPVYDKVYPFSDGLAAIQERGLWGFIDETGTKVIPPSFLEIGFFSEGLCAVRPTSDQAWGYIDKKGKVVIKPQFDVCTTFHHGVARVGFETTRSKLFSWMADTGSQHDYKRIDTTGRFVSEPALVDFAIAGKEDQRILFEQEGLFGYSDAEGRIVIPPRFASAFPFSDGLACVRVKDHYGYIDKEGSFVIPPRFAYPSPFSEGLAGVPLGPRGWGFIDTTGKEVLPPRFDWIYSGFRHGLIEVASGGKAGYIDKTGKWIWEPSD